MFGRVERIDCLSLTNIKDIPKILNNINNEVIQEKFRDLNIFSFRYFSLDQIFYIAKNCNCQEIREMAVKEIILTSKGNEHFEYIKRLREEVDCTDSVIAHNINRVLDSNMTQLSISDEKYNILSNIDENIIFKNLKSIYFLPIFNELEKCVKDVDGYNEAMINSFKDIILNCGDISELLNYFNNSDFVNKHQHLLDENIDLIISKLLISSIGELNKENLLLFYELLIKDLLNREDIGINDMQYVDKGSYCYVYKLSDIVVKFGKNINCRDIPKHSRILKPIIRPYISNSNRYIEVQYLADTGNFSMDDAYLVYKELRDDGIIWVDCKPSNLGRLKTDNLNRYQDIQSCDNAVGFVNKNSDINDTLLHKGDIVIIDNDLIFYEKDFDIEKLKELNINLRLYYYFEDKYRKETQYVKIKGF